MVGDNEVTMLLDNYAKSCISQSNKEHLETEFYYPDEVKQSQEHRTTLAKSHNRFLINLIILMINSY